MSPEFRQSFEDLAKQSSSNPDVILAPIKNELTIKDLLPVDQSTIEPIENENRSGESFQLQKLLIDATPELLEKGVEEGVRLLDTLKGQMLTDASTDAMQWVQQIGTYSCQLLIYWLTVDRCFTRASCENKNCYRCCRQHRSR